VRTNGSKPLEKKIFLVKKKAENVFHRSPCSFSGGSEPNLADLNVYGILTSIQGCQAFQDLMANTKIQPWFERMKHRVETQ
jgi:hypothetical protein